MLKIHNGVDPQLTAALRELVQSCIAEDKTIPKIYWNIIKEEREIANDLFFYRDDRLIGYLTGFLFAQREIEISACIHPDYRQKGIFKALYNMVKSRILPFTPVSYFLFPCPRGNDITKQCITSWGAKHFRTEYYMGYSPKLRKKTPEQYEITLRRATLDDVDLLARIDNVSFSTKFETMQKRFQEIIPAKNRKAWLAYVDDRCVGKIHTRFDDDRILIHEFCIMQEARRKGYGAQVLQQTVDILSNAGQKVGLDVEADNENAVHLYLANGFEIVQAYDYHRLDN
ncbi:MAG: GNAT family N-acetyltransferase, partial [Gammaproteobacteria bacterium]